MQVGTRELNLFISLMRDLKPAPTDGDFQALWGRLPGLIRWHLVCNRGALVKITKETEQLFWQMRKNHELAYDENGLVPNIKEARLGEILKELKFPWNDSFRFFLIDVETAYPGALDLIPGNDLFAIFKHNQKEDFMWVMHGGEKGIKLQQMTKVQIEACMRRGREARNTKHDN
jgi:hypothetical protein